MNLQRQAQNRHVSAQSCGNLRIGLASPTACCRVGLVDCGHIPSLFAEHLFRTPSLVGQVIACCADLSDFFIRNKRLNFQQGLACLRKIRTRALCVQIRICFLRAISTLTKEERAGCEQDNFGRRLPYVRDLRLVVTRQASRHCMVRVQVRSGRPLFPATLSLARPSVPQPIWCIVKARQANVTDRGGLAPRHIEQTNFRPRRASPWRGLFTYDGAAPRVAPTGLSPIAPLTHFKRTTGAHPGVHPGVLRSTLTQTKDTTCSPRS